MKLNYEKLKQYRPGIIDLENYKQYAVGLPLLVTGDDSRIVFEVRASHMKTLPGDICLPGGSVEVGETPAQAVIREVSEELLLSADKVELLGAGDIFITGKESVIYPFIVLLHDYTGTFQHSEVKEIFTVPLEFFLHAKPEYAYTTITDIPDEDFPFEKIQGGRNYPWIRAKKRIVFYQYEERIIWGLTGKIMESFAKLLPGLIMSNS